MSKRIVVTGGRDYNDVPRIWAILACVSEKYGPLHIIDGASDDVTGPYVGADYWANQWANAMDYATTRCHAEWKKHGRAAGPIRNQTMIDEHRPDIVVAFPGGNGTEDMVRRAHKANIKVIEVK